MWTAIAGAVAAFIKPFIDALIQRRDIQKLQRQKDEIAGLKQAAEARHEADSLPSSPTNLIGNGMHSTSNKLPPDDTKTS